MPNLSEVVANKLETGKAFEDLNRIFFSTDHNPDEDFYRFGNHVAYPVVLPSTNFSNPYDTEFFVPNQPNLWESPHLIDKRCPPSTNNFTPFNVEQNDSTNVFLSTTSVHAFPELPNAIRSTDRGFPKKSTIRCRHCSFVLPTIYDRKRHEKLSHGSFLLTCDSCNRKFPSKAMLTKHIYNSKCAPPSSSIKTFN